MEAADVLGHVEFAVLGAVQSGALRTGRTARKIPGLSGRPGEEAILHEVLRRCERDGLLRSGRDASGRWYELTAAGRTRLRVDRRFRLALAGLLARGSAQGAQ
jgi:DNA-binding PadR family transcriptional regulator